MKIRTVKSDYASVMARKPYVRKKPVRTNIFFRTLLRVLSKPELRSVNFKVKKEGMERLGKDENAFILMNHSSFIDLKIASVLLYPRPFNIICEFDGFVGKEWLMRSIGCVPTNKFTSDTKLVKDMMYMARTLKTDILMYPEASYSFDGTSPAPLPASLGKCVKLLKLPLVMIKTEGAFHRDPLYNRLRLRKCDVSATMEYLLSPDEIAAMSVDEINALLAEKFTFDHFQWQKDNRIEIAEPFRAEGLESVLYKCPHCQSEGKMETEGAKIRCTCCGKEYVMDTYGALHATEGETEFSHIPSWSKWEREMVEKEIDEGSYRIDVPVDIFMQKDTSAVYSVGKGRLLHTSEGFTLSDESGKVLFTRAPLDTYSLASDIYWYEMGDMVGLTSPDCVFFCFPGKDYAVAYKTRMAAEHIYRKALESVKKGGM